MDTDKTKEATELFKEIPEYLQITILDLIRSLLAEQSSNPVDQE